MLFPSRISAPWSVVSFDYFDSREMGGGWDQRKPKEVACREMQIAGGWACVRACVTLRLVWREGKKGEGRVRGGGV